MSTTVPVIRVNATGALIRLHDGNRTLLKNPAVTESTAEIDSKTGKLTEINGADYTLMVSASKDLVRIGTALAANRSQRQSLLTAALKLPGAENYLTTLGVYEGKEDAQYIDPNTLKSNNEGLPDVEVQVLTQAEMRAMRDKAVEPAKKPAKKKAPAQAPDPELTQATPDPLADL